VSELREQVQKGWRVKLTMLSEKLLYNLIYQGKLRNSMDIPKEGNNVRGSKSKTTAR
jgi:hypothetical protein